MKLIGGNSVSKIPLPPSAFLFSSQHQLDIKSHCSTMEPAIYVLGPFSLCQSCYTQRKWGGKTCQWTTKLDLESTFSWESSSIPPRNRCAIPTFDRRSLYLMYVYAVSQCAKSPILLTINWHKRANPLSFQKQWMVNRSAPGKTTWSSHIQSDSRPHQMSGKDSTTQRRILFHEENAVPFFSSFYFF